MFGLIGWFFILFMGMGWFCLKVLWICSFGLVIYGIKCIFGVILFFTTGAVPFFK